MTRIQEKITPLMDKLQSLIESDANDLESLANTLALVSLYRSHMNDEDKDYCDYVEWKLEEND